VIERTGLLAVPTTPAAGFGAQPLAGRGDHVRVGPLAQVGSKLHRVGRAADARPDGHRSACRSGAAISGLLLLRQAKRPTGQGSSSRSKQADNRGPRTGSCTCPPGWDIRLAGLQEASTGKAMEKSPPVWVGGEKAQRPRQESMVDRRWLEFKRWSNQENWWPREHAGSRGHGSGSARATSSAWVVIVTSEVGLSQRGSARIRTQSGRRRGSSGSD